METVTRTGEEALLRRMEKSTDIEEEDTIRVDDEDVEDDQEGDVSGMMECTFSADSSDQVLATTESDIAADSEPLLVEVRYMSSTQCSKV